MLTCLLRWNRSRKEPSFEKTLTGFGLAGAFEVVEGRDVEEEEAEGGVAYGESAMDMVDRENEWSQNNVKELGITCAIIYAARRTRPTMFWLRHHADRPPSPPPPPWTSAAEQSYEYGRFNEALQQDCNKADVFCARNAVEPSRLLPTTDVDRITAEGTNAWGLEFYITDPTFMQRQTFHGSIANQSKLPSGTGVGTKVETTRECKDCCLISNFPFISGLYHRTLGHDKGVYFEVTIHKMNGVIALGHCTAIVETRAQT